MRISSSAVLLALAAFAAPQARAQSSAGAESLEFLLLDANARAVGVAGAYTALANDSNALLYNPAGLGRVRMSEATFMHNQYAAGASQQYVGAALKRGFGFQLNYLSVGDIPRTTLANPDGTGSKFNVSDTSLGAGYGRAVGPDLSLGAGAKYINESLGDASYSAYAADFGALYRLPELRNLTLGAALLNVGPGVKVNNATEKLPTLIRAGGAYSFRFPRNEAVAALDITKTPLDKPRLSIGFETEIDQSFALRAGFTTRDDAGIGLRAGVGWKGQNLGADYAFAPLGALGTAHRISLTLRWGQRDDPAQARAPANGTPEWHLAQAQLAIDAGRLSAARTYLNAGLRRLGNGDRRRVRFHERLGSVSVLEKDFAGGLAAYSEGVNFAYAQGYSDESVADSYVGIGLCLAAGKNYTVAERSFRKALEIGPSPASLQVANERLKALAAAKPAAPDAAGGPSEAVASPQ